MAHYTWAYTGELSLNEIAEKIIYTPALLHPKRTVQNLHDSSARDQPYPYHIRFGSSTDDSDVGMGNAEVRLSDDWDMVEAFTP